MSMQWVTSAFALGWVPPNMREYQPYGSRLEGRKRVKLGDGCRHVFLDVGANLAVHVRFLMEGKRVFLSNVLPGENVQRAIFDAIDRCECAVILASATYGKCTTTFSTYQEMNSILTNRKPFFLIKMCDYWEVWAGGGSNAAPVNGRRE